MNAWTEVPAATLSAREARAVRWAGDGWPGWRSVIQIERAVTADHVFLHMVTVRGSASEAEIVAALTGGGEASALNLADLTGLRTVLDGLIGDLESGR